MTGYLMSTAILFRLSRLGMDDNDTNLDRARLISFDLNYQVDAPGSTEEYLKDV